MSDNGLKELTGPWGIPVFGSLLSLTTFKEQTLMKWAEENYGPVFIVRMGSSNVVVLNGYEAIQEAMTSKAQVFSGRFERPVFDVYRGDRGLFFKQYDQEWQKWRNFAHDGLEHVFETIQKGILSETVHLRKSFDELSEPSYVYDGVLNAVVNTITQACFSRRFESTDKQIIEILSLAYMDIRESKFHILVLMPWLSFLPSFKRFLERVVENKNKLGKKILELVDERMAEPRKTRDLVTYFYEGKQTPTADEREGLAFVLADLVQAGTTTSTGQFLWILLFLLKNPESMTRLQEELDAVLSECDDPVEGAITHKFSELNFSRAVLEETLRMRPVAPTGLLHQTLDDTSVMGYKVPKNATVMPNLWSVHHDKQYWSPDPEVFRPERHLDQSGSFRKSGHVIPFGAGWRCCVGPKVVRQNLFAHMVNIFYYYDVTLSPEDVNIDMAGISTTLLNPPPFKVAFNARRKE